MAGDGDEEFAPYTNKTAKVKADKYKNHLRGLYLKLKAQNAETESQMSVALKLKTELHLNRLVENFALSRATMAAIVEDVAELTYLGEPDDSDAMKTYESWDKKFKELSTSVKDAEGSIGEAIANRQPVQAAAVAVADEGARRPNLPKANDPLKPRELQLDDKPSVLRLFKREFEDYYESNKMGLLPVRVQQQYFLQCVSTKLKIKIRQLKMDVTPVLAVAFETGDIEPDSCYKFLDDIFRTTHPMVRRRQDFFNYMQRGNQKTSDYLDKLRELFDEAELQQFKAEDLLTYKAIQGCTVEPVRTKFVREEEPTFKKLEKIAHTIEAGENTLLGQTSTAVAAMAERQSPRGQKPIGKGNSPSTDCGRCLGRDKSNHDKTSCRFKDVVCYDCGKKGHIKGASFCRQDGKDSESAQKVNAATCGSVQLLRN